MTAVYLVAFAIGALALLATLLVGEIADAGHHDALPFLSLTSLATAIFGFGAGGAALDRLDVDEPLPLIGAAVFAVALVVVFRGLLMPYLLRQQSNSHFTRASYVGLLGRVELAIPVDGWGEISLVEPAGGRVRVKARSSEAVPLPPATKVYITDVEADVVHVVAVPELTSGTDPGGNG